MNKTDLAEVVNIIKSTYGSRFQEFTKSVADVWFECLKDLNRDMLINATYNYVKKNQYPPTIADLRQEYEALDDERRRKRVQLRDTYNSTLAIYPCAYDEQPEVDKVYKSILMEYPVEERQAVADKIYRKVDDFVRAWERKKDPNIITLTEYLKSGDWR